MLDELLHNLSYVVPTVSLTRCNVLRRVFFIQLYIVSLAVMNCGYFKMSSRCPPLPYMATTAKYLRNWLEDCCLMFQTSNYHSCIPIYVVVVFH